MKFDFCGKKALVTGASKGIGRCIAESLARNGAQVYALSRNEELLKTLTNQFPTVTSIKCDLAQTESIIREALKPHLPFHFAVNNAGVLIPGSFLDVSESDLDTVMSTNFKAPLIVSQIVARSMIEHEIKGSIVHISSLISSIPAPQRTAYCCSKAALDMLCKVMALELGPKGIRVNCVNPGITWTDMAMQTFSDPEKQKAPLQRTSLKEFATVEDVSNATLFLLSDAAAKTTGTILHVDGGFHST